jgi:TetR/AcrR family fatty acid metabolism transcriptional regulator
MNMVVQKRHATAVRREEIADATRKLIAERGSETITIRAIAKKVGITQSSIYQHFKSKKEIFLFLTDDIRKTLLTAFSQVPTKGESSLDALDILLRRHILGIRKNRKGVHFLLVPELSRLHDKDVNERITEGTNNLISHLKAFLSRGVELGEVREDLDLDAMAMLIFNMVSGLVNTWAISNAHISVLEEKYVYIWNVFRKAIAKC